MAAWPIPGARHGRNEPARPGNNAPAAAGAAQVGVCAPLGAIEVGVRATIDMVGKRCGKLVVLERAGSDQSRGRSQSHALWSCLCDCGGTIVVAGGHLREGRVLSCGCARRRAWVKGRRDESRPWPLKLALAIL
jgi:hypothetical protein